MAQQTEKQSMDQLKNFGDTAKQLAHNPLGIIALFLVLVYGVAALVTGFTNSFTGSERVPLIYFLVLFPFIVLGVFTWLVSKHSGKLFAPSDFRNEEIYMALQHPSIDPTAVKRVSEEVAQGKITPEQGARHLEQTALDVREYRILRALVDEDHGRRMEGYYRSSFYSPA